MQLVPKRKILDSGNRKFGFRYYNSSFWDRPAQLALLQVFLCVFEAFFDTVTFYLKKQQYDDDKNF
jgi:hypothetical protein